MNKKTEELKNMWFEKGCNYWTSGNYDLADECFDEALALDKNDPLSWYNKGTSLLHNEQYNDAIFCFKTLLASNLKKRPDSRMVRSLFFLEAARKKQAQMNS